MDKARARLPRGVWALGFVSLFMDISSEMVHALLPVFLVGTLGASHALVGLIEGLGEATAQVVKFLSGWLSDRTGRRKPLALLGYGLSALTKPAFALAQGAGLVLAARVTDRVGKGIRGAPRDAMIADMVPEAQRGAAYGLRQSLDTIGAFIGPLLALGLMWALAGDVRMVFALSVIPAVVAVAVLWVHVREPGRDHGAGRAVPDLSFAAMARLGRGFWSLVGIGAVLTLARLSEAFLILRALDLGLPGWAAPLVLVGMNIVYALTATPFGARSDRTGRRGILVAGFLVLAVALGLMGVAGDLWVMGAAVLLWGLHMGMTQGLLAAEVAGAAPKAMRGTAFGLFNLVTGLALLVANGAGGAIWAVQGATAACALAAGCAVLGAALLVLRRPAPAQTAA
ncbi:MAG: hypothetical protein RLZZ528_830 [Pseudomonadota bacterium]